MKTIHRIKITSRIAYNRFVKDALSNYKRVTNKNIITPAYFSGYLTKLKEAKKYRANTIYTHTLSFGRMFREYFIHRKNSKTLNQYLAIIKLHRIQRPSRVYSPDDVFSPSDFIDLVLHIKSVNYKLSLITMLLYYTGARISEGMAIRLSDCKSLGEWTEIEIKNGKGRKDRFVICPSFIIEEAKTLQPKTYLFESRDFAKYSPRWIQKQYTLLSKKYKKRVTAHLLRHSFATEHMNSGTNPEILAKLMGNSVSTILKTYNHPKPDYSALNNVLISKTAKLINKYRSAK